MNAVQRLAHWKTLLAGWQLGTRAVGDPECDAVRDHREATLMLRAEMTALTALLIDKGVFTADELAERLEAEAEYYSGKLAERFPGVEATDAGLELDLRAMETMRGWRP